MARLTLRGYAKHRGCSLGAVQYALKVGRIRRGRDGLIDSGVADRQWKARTDVVRSAAGKRSADHRKAEDRTHEPDPVADMLMRAKAASASFKARRDELEFLQFSQQMIPIEDHRKAASESGRRVKLLLQNMGDRVGPLVAGRDVPDAVRLINEEAARILEELSTPGKNGHDKP